MNFGLPAVPQAQPGAAPQAGEVGSAFKQLGNHFVADIGARAGRFQSSADAWTTCGRSPAPAGSGTAATPPLPPVAVAQPLAHHNSFLLQAAHPASPTLSWART